MNKLLAFGILLVWNLGFTQKIAVAKYSGGGDWYANPTSLPNLAKFCNQNINTKINTKIEQLQEQDIIYGFNPGSPIQKQNFFKFCGIESEKETKTGNPQWDRAELERLQKLINIMIDEKGESHESES